MHPPEDHEGRVAQRLARVLTQALGQHPHGGQPEVDQRLVCGRRAGGRVLRLTLQPCRRLCQRGFPVAIPAAPSTGAGLPARLDPWCTGVGLKLSPLCRPQLVCSPPESAASSSTPSPWLPRWLWVTSQLKSSSIRSRKRTAASTFCCAGQVVVGWWGWWWGGGTQADSARQAGTLAVHAPLAWLQSTERA